MASNHSEQIDHPKDALDYTRISATLKLLAHPERLRILDALRHDAECVCHLEALLDKPQPYVSQQLRLLREFNVIQDEKEGNNVYYHLVAPEITAWLEQILGPVSRTEDGRARHNHLDGCCCPKCGESKCDIAVPPRAGRAIAVELF